MASLPAYQAAQQAVGCKPTAWAYADLATLKRWPRLDQVFTQKNTNPVAVLALGGLYETVQKSTWAALAAEVEGSGITLKLVAGGGSSVSAPTAFAVPAEPGQGALPNLVVPRQIGAASVYRDLRAFYANKDKLFPERTPGLILFENLMGIFFSGRDLTEDVLGEAKPEIRIVVAAQEYGSGPMPQVKTPAYAAVFRMRHPNDFNEVAVEAWQKAIGIANTQRGQKGLPGFIFACPTHNGVTFNMARYSNSKQDSQDKLGSRFNTRPCLAQVGEYLILSSSEGLTNDLIDAAKKEIDSGVRPLAGTSNALEVDAVQAASATAGEPREPGSPKHGRKGHFSRTGRDGGRHAGNAGRAHG